MTITSIFSTVPILVIAAAFIALSVPSVAFAHVTVKPSEVVTAEYQTFTVNVPNEKEIPTTSVKVLVPSGIKTVTPTQKAGWQVTVEKEGEGEAAIVKSVTWSEGTISDGLRDEFTFSAKVPGETGELQWKAYQTYADGTVVSWDKEDEDGHGHGDGTSGPFSVTKIVTDTASDVSIQQSEQAAVDARAAADRANYIGAAGVIVGLVAVFFATRRK